jgi:hypothetical protein
MFRLIRKELILNKRYFLVVGLLYLAYMGYFGSRIHSPTVYALFCTLMFSFVPLLSLTREDKFKAASMSCSLPVTRKEIVLSRYFLCWMMIPLLAAAATAIATAIPGSKLILTGLLKPNVLGFSLLFAALLISFLIPFLVRFGLAGMLVFLVGFQVLGTILLLLQARLKLSPRAVIAGLKTFLYSLNRFAGAAGYWLILIAGVIFVSFLSISISVALFKRKEV